MLWDLLQNSLPRWAGSFGQRPGSLQEVRHPSRSKGLITDTSAVRLCFRWWSTINRGPRIVFTTVRATAFTGISRINSHEQRLEQQIVPGAGRANGASACFTPCWPMWRRDRRNEVGDRRVCLLQCTKPFEKGTHVMVMSLLSPVN